MHACLGRLDPQCMCIQMHQQATQHFPFVNPPPTTTIQPMHALRPQKIPLLPPSTPPTPRLTPAGATTNTHTMRRTWLMLLRVQCICKCDTICCTHPCMSVSTSARLAHSAFAQASTITFLFCSPCTPLSPTSTSLYTPCLPTHPLPPTPPPPQEHCILTLCAGHGTCCPSSSGNRPMSFYSQCHGWHPPSFTHTAYNKRKSSMLMHAHARPLQNAPHTLGHFVLTHSADHGLMLPTVHLLKQAPYNPQSIYHAPSLLQMPTHWLVSSAQFHPPSSSRPPSTLTQCAIRG